jgi:hypothetical protein
MAKVMEFRDIRRGINRPLEQRTARYHQEILGITTKFFPDRPSPLFDTVGVLKVIQASSYGQSRRKAIFELLKRTFADAMESGTITRNPLAGQVPKKDRVLPT